MAILHPLLMLEVTLDDVTDPAVTRTIQVPGNYTFNMLHMVINIAFGWQNSHLHEFSSQLDEALIIGEPDSDFWEERDIKDERKIKIFKYLTKAEDEMMYDYDFGDGWTHTIVTKEVHRIPKSNLRAKLLGASGACPPEDCGGNPGYENLKKVLSNPKNKEYKFLSQWMGLKPSEKFNPWDSKMIMSFMEVELLN